MILLRAVWNWKVAGVQEDGERDGDRIRVKRITTVLRGRERDLGHIRAS